MGMLFKLSVTVTSTLHFDSDDFGERTPNQVAIDHQDAANADEEQADSLLNTIIDFGTDTKFIVEVAD